MLIEMRTRALFHADSIIIGEQIEKPQTGNRDV